MFCYHTKFLVLYKFHNFFFEKCNDADVVQPGYQHMTDLWWNYVKDNQSIPILKANAIIGAFIKEFRGAYGTAFKMLIQGRTTMARFTPAVIIFFRTIFFKFLKTLKKSCLANQSPRFRLLGHSDSKQVCKKIAMNFFSLFLIPYKFIGWIQLLALIQVLTLIVLVVERTYYFRRSHIADHIHF